MICSRSGRTQADAREIRPALMRAFIIRPFGEKAGIDFDRVEVELIAPALERLQILGGTTGTVIEAGNIREDMFQLLLVSDVVVADISIDNPNAYYELGVRHALKEKRTFLIRAVGMTSDVPFDLRTDRYLPYDPSAPGDALDALCAGLRATLASDRQDSPVFRVLPELREQDRSRFLPIPREFREEVEYAARWRMRGKLALLGQEAGGSLWESEGLRLVGREQFRAGSFEAAAVTLDDLRRLDPLDAEVNLLLGTIHQRLGDLPRSEEALLRVVDHRDTSARDRAEAWSLLGRNLKTRWRDGWKELGAESRRLRALDSPLLMQSYDAYCRGFRQDLNHFYSGLNALAMLTVAIELARALPDTWADAFSDADEALRRRTELETQQGTLRGAVELSIQASRQQAERAGTPDPWANVSMADLRFLTAERPEPVVRSYREVIEGQPDFVGDAVRGQLRLYQELNLFAAKVNRVLEVLAPPPPAAEPAASPRTILFTGHQVDPPERREPRFPPDRELVARAAIREAVSREAAGPGGAVGMAGAASGGDILFHEVCMELGVPSSLYLALPAVQYLEESVAPAGGDWIRRFWAIRDRFPQAPVLGLDSDMPGWLQHPGAYSIWQRNNLWMLNEALAAGARNVTVLALWNGKQGDGPGGTTDMIDIAKARGAEIRVLDSNALFGL
jgi:tetratricopeptide (TPR) repeat protein